MFRFSICSAKSIQKCFIQRMNERTRKKRTGKERGEKHATDQLIAP
jgi:hypothetical protein